MIDRTARFWFAGILAGLALMAALAFVILGPGRFDPSPPSLRDNPNQAIPGLIAYRDRDGCAHVIEASGRNDRELYCGARFIDSVVFIDGRTIAVVEYRGGTNPHWTAVDIETGETTDLGTYPAPRPDFNFDPTLGGRIRVEDDGDVLAVEEDGSTRLIYEASYPEYYRPNPIMLSPDGEWLVLQYSGPRSDGIEIWLVAMYGTTAGTITDDASWGTIAASWWIDGFGVEPDVAVPGAPAQ